MAILLLEYAALCYKPRTMLSKTILSLLLSSGTFIPFSQVKHKDLLPAYEEAFSLAYEQLDEIVKNPEAPNFKNTIEAYDHVGAELERLNALFSIFSGNIYDKDFSENDEPKINKIFSAFEESRLANKKLFERIKLVFDEEQIRIKENKSTLSGEQLKLLEKTYNAFSKEGALLSDADQKKLADIRLAIDNSRSKYSNNLIEDKQLLGIWVNDKAQIAGIPEYVVEDALALARKKESNPELESKWFFSVKNAHSVLQHAEDEDLRRQMMNVIFSIGRSSERNNIELAKQISKLRHQEAVLLGYQNYSEYALEDTMADKVEVVEKMIEDLRAKAMPRAKVEVQELKDFVTSLEGSDQPLHKPWNRSYYVNKLEEAKYKFKSEDLRPYFSLNNILPALFDVAADVYGAKVELVDGVDVFHPDVKVYKVSDDHGNLLGHVYADFFARDNKSQGAWQAGLVSQGYSVQKGEVERPLVVIVSNFLKPQGDKPVLILPSEVETLFHEFGHALHSLFSNVHYKSLSGTKVPRDFVELPSMLTERFVMTPEFLQKYARHYQTGEPMPAELLNRALEAKNFWSANMLLVSLEYTSLDLAWYSKDPSTIDNVQDMEFKNFERFRASDFVPHHSRVLSANFSHIFAGGYASNYYSYAWSDVLAADAFSAFKESSSSGSVFNKEVGKKCSELLSKGGSVDPTKLYRDFRGRDVDPTAFLKERGLE